MTLGSTASPAADACRLTYRTIDMPTFGSVQSG
ncbi:hypothetical protein Poly21_25320 [Allorhodopirellula heiligendammensis]|uniref:Uncharacterized protein n=1 Tax=Allorhodopirellula heiligendammensis TaxID=2714739 RepID=A0A5C6BUL3_9BACT|nr:hypothetical protein Poly21_25320 [Allorhodopirellula heiligendammensis]